MRVLSWFAVLVGLAFAGPVAAVDLTNLNHLFQTCKTGSVTEYGSIEETIAPAALETIANWILKRTEGRQGSEQASRRRLRAS